MEKQSAAYLQSTLDRLANGNLAGNNFGKTLKSAFQLNILDEKAVAEIMGVDPAHVYSKAQSLKTSEVKALCKKLGL